MVSFTSILLALATAVVVQADYDIQPSSVPLSTRQVWCQSELSICRQICQQTPPGTTKVNTCDVNTLTYGCICGDGKQPNVSEYSLTLPYFVCTEWGNQCVADCGNNNCASDCRENHPCGAQNPSPPNSSVTATAATATASATASATDQVYDGFDGSTSSNSGAVAVLAKGQMGGMLVVMGTLFVGFTFML